MPDQNLPNPPGDRLASAAAGIAFLRATLDELDDRISTIEDLAGRDECMALSQAIRVAVDRLEDRVTRLAAGL